MKLQGKEPCGCQLDRTEKLKQLAKKMSILESRRQKKAERLERRRAELEAKFSKYHALWRKITQLDARAARDGADPNAIVRKLSELRATSVLFAASVRHFRRKFPEASQDSLEAMAFVRTEEETRRNGIQNKENELEATH